MPFPPCSGDRGLAPSLLLLPSMVPATRCLLGLPPEYPQPGCRSRRPLLRPLPVLCSSEAQSTALGCLRCGFLSVGMPPGGHGSKGRGDTRLGLGRGRACSVYVPAVFPLSRAAGSRDQDFSILLGPEGGGHHTLTSAQAGCRFKLGISCLLAGSSSGQGDRVALGL